MKKIKIEVNRVSKKRIKSLFCKLLKLDMSLKERVTMTRKIKKSNKADIKLEEDLDPALVQVQVLDHLQTLHLPQVLVPLDVPIGNLNNQILYVKQ